MPRRSSVLSHVYLCARAAHIHANVTHNILVFIMRKAYKLPNYGEKRKFSRLQFQIFELYQFSRQIALRHEK